MYNNCAETTFFWDSYNYHGPKIVVISKIIDVIIQRYCDTWMGRGLGCECRRSLPTQAARNGGDDTSSHTTTNCTARRKHRYIFIHRHTRR